jgi:signal transduction histidine kinase
MSFKPISLERLSPRELRTIYEISRVILQTVDSALALKEIIRISRPVFIFDNVVLYQPREDHSLEPIYARAIGRGRSVGADMTWGEAIACDVLEKEDIILRHEGLPSRDDGLLASRLDSRYFLGLPLKVEEKVKAALVFIRFGGPDFLTEQVNLACLIAEHIEHLLERQNLVGRVADLEAERKLDRLQQEFVATVSHDLRSPLGFIKGYTTTLLRKDAVWDNDSRREFLSIIDEETDRLSRLIDNLLDSSRLQSGTLPMEFQPLRIDQLLTEFAQRVQMGDFNVEILLNLETSDEKIYIDPTRMIQVFDNLISNAAKYAPGSPVTISLAWEPEFVHIVVSDTGPGIPDSQLENVFKRFYRLSAYREIAKGSGLGLFICRQIINAHQGEIYVRSTLGVESSFHILLPRNWSPVVKQPLEEE